MAVLSHAALTELVKPTTVEEEVRLPESPFDSIYPLPHARGMRATRGAEQFLLVPSGHVGSRVEPENRRGREAKSTVLLQEVEEVPFGISL